MSTAIDTGPEIASGAAPRRREVIYRHTFLVRLTHWLNALAIFVMIGSGLNIFNAHPHLYWGQKGSELRPAVPVASTLSTAPAVRAASPRSGR